MADVTISELAEVVGVSVDKLLSQVKEAGLPHAKADELISNEDKNTLLVFLRRSHGDRDASSAAPKKITLKRKTIGTLKAASNSGRGKTVNVEVRKKRTYVKRSAIDTPPEEEELPVEEQQAEAEEVAAAETCLQQMHLLLKRPKQRLLKPSQKNPSAAEAKPAELDAKKAPPPEADANRGSKAAPRRKKGTDKGPDDPIDKKKSHLRNKGKAQAPKRQAKNIHVNDDFVLEGDDFDAMGARGRRGGRKAKSKLSSQHAFEKPTEFIAREITIGDANTVADLSRRCRLNQPKSSSCYSIWV
jgi:translation initiation factor IF-2